MDRLGEITCSVSAFLRRTRAGGTKTIIAATVGRRGVSARSPLCPSRPPVIAGVAALVSLAAVGHVAPVVGGGHDAHAVDFGDVSEI